VYFCLLKTFLISGYLFSVTNQFLSSKFFIALHMNLSLLLYEVYMHFAANSPFSTLPEAYNKPVSLESM